MRPSSLLAIVCTLSLAATALSVIEAAPEGSTDPNAEPQPKTADQPVKKEEGAKPSGTHLSDRLEVKVGSAWLALRSSTRGTTRFFDAVSDLTLQQTMYEKFNKAGGMAGLVDVTYKILPRLSAFGDFTVSHPTGSRMTDDRLIGNFGGPGDFRLVQFASDAGPDYDQLNVGGAFQILPTKKHGPSNQYLDLVVEFQSTRAAYEFESGVETHDPFDPNVLTDPVFTAFSNSRARYFMNFLNLGGGFKVGGKIGKKINVDAKVVAYVFGRYSGEGRLPHHGLPFVHTSSHVDPRFHVPGCFTDNNPSTPPCGLVDVDLNTSDLTVHQKSEKSRGLNSVVTFDYSLTDWFGIEAGYRRTFVRSSGGTEVRVFSGPGSCDIPKSTTMLPPGKFLPDCGDLNKAEILADTAYLIGRFRFF
jgi:hypothetical protein